MKNLLLKYIIVFNLKKKNNRLIMIRNNLLTDYN
jgi:hypothetical protein